MRKRTIVSSVTLPLHIVQADCVRIMSMIVVLLPATVSVVSHLTTSLVLTTFVLATASSCNITKASAKVSNMVQQLQQYSLHKSLVQYTLQLCISRKNYKIK